MQQATANSRSLGTIVWVGSEDNGEIITLTLQIIPSYLVVLQSIIESYDGLGTVRTLDEELGKVVVYTHKSQLENCRALLDVLLKLSVN